MTCLTEGFTTIGSALALTVSINGKSDSSQSLSVASTVASVTSITPTSYSPVLKTNVYIVLSSDYSGSYDRDDFLVYLVPQSPSS